MNERRRALGRGLGALIPTDTGLGGRPVDTFFSSPDRTAPQERIDGRVSGSEEAPPSGVAQQREATGAIAGDPATARDAPAEVPAITQDPATERAEAAPEGLRPVPGAQFTQLPVTAIRPNPRQPRQSFDEDDMAELVHSVRHIGILQPIVVRAIEPASSTSPEAEAGPSFELIMGERRWRAAQAAGLRHIPAIVRDTDDDALLRDALLENLHRSQLNPLEEAAAYQQLLEDFGCTKEELASRIGRSRPQVSNTLRLLRLPPPVQRRVAAGVLSAGHARALLGLTDSSAIEQLAARIVAEGLSVRTVEEIVTLGAAAPAPRAPRRPSRATEFGDVASELSDRLDTRVQVSMGRRKGRLTIEFASGEDLQRILDVMGMNLS